MTHKVFVYGTLKRAHRNHFLLEQATFVGDGQTVGQFRLFHAGFPVLRPRAKHGEVCRYNARVRGEVYEVDDETLHRLDRLESEGRMYHRKSKLVRLDDGRMMMAQLYIGDTQFWNGRVRSYMPPIEAYNWPCEPEAGR